jgi:hypothetical protein
MEDTVSQKAKSSMIKTEEKDIKANNNYIKNENFMDEKITNNMMTVNIFLSVFILLIILYYTIFSDKLIFVDLQQSEESLKSHYVYFSLFHFDYYQPNHSKIVFPYYCITNTTSCENKCEYDVRNLLKYLPFDCHQFKQLSLSGVIVKFELYFI